MVIGFSLPPLTNGVGFFYDFFLFLFFYRSVSSVEGETDLPVALNAEIPLSVKESISNFLRLAEEYTVAYQLSCDNRDSPDVGRCDDAPARPPILLDAIASLSASNSCGETDRSCNGRHLLTPSIQELLKVVANKIVDRGVDYVVRKSLLLLNFICLKQ